MTGPVSGEPVRGETAARTTTRDDVGGILVLLALGLTFRVIIAYLLPGSGFANDIGAFQYWASNLASDGPERVLLPSLLPRLHARIPLRPVAGRARRPGRGRRRDLIKVPPILADVALAYLVWSMTLELGGSRWAARLAALIVAGQPDHLVRQRGLGPGRLVRRRLPAARACASCGAIGPSGRRS